MHLSMLRWSRPMWRTSVRFATPVRHPGVTSAGLTGGSLAMKLFHRSEPPIWAEMSVAAPKNRWNPSAVPGSERLLLVQRSVEMFLRTGSTL
jgi:hypothetical protein